MDVNMTELKVTVEYFTCGQLQLLLYDNDQALATPPIVHAMQATDGRIWTYVCNNTDNKIIYFRFRHVVDGETADEEMPGLFHSVYATTERSIEISCLWNTKDATEYRYSSAFSACIFNNTQLSKVELSKRHGVKFHIHNYLVPVDKELALTGSHPMLGEWQSSRSLKASYLGNCSWEVCLPPFPDNFEYKYILIDKNTGDVTWETGQNRQFIAERNGELVVEEKPCLPEYSPRLAGVVVPVFSLRSNNSYGVGDFGDLKLMIDWVVACGLHALQVLPINDTSRSGSWEDSYPYNGISAFALHPMYADLRDLPLKNTDLLAAFNEKAQWLNALKQVDYEEVVALKNDYLKVYYRENPQIRRKKDFKKYIADNEAWLFPYAAFRVLQEVYKTSDFHHWPEHSLFNKDRVTDWIKKTGHSDDVLYYQWVQYLLETQLKGVHDYARKHGIILKGDIPIGISRDSATAWLNPQYFNFDGQAGAPPDYFSETGQNWGFPTYNWETILADGGTWWQQRLLKMATYFDAYRIDHVIGFMRIWEIPYQYIYGTLGHFNPAKPLAKTEIYNYGFCANVDRLSVPLFTENDLRDLFGENFEIVVIRFFSEQTDGFYKLKDAYLSQRQIVDETVEGPIRHKLMKAASDVLFITDKKEQGKYHPNIDAWRTYAYKHLSDSDRQAYDRLSRDFFYNRHDAWWTQGAVKKLSILTGSTRMLACAEDLGMVPSGMRDVLSRLNILSLEVESMPKRSWGRFADVYTNPYLSVDTITTHDMAPLRLWWRQNREAAQDYFKNVLKHDGEVPLDMPAELCLQTISRHLHSSSMLCIIALQDWLGIDEVLRSTDLSTEQINNPSVSRHYWRYRMHLTIEKLIGSERLSKCIKNLVKEAGR